MSADLYILRIPAILLALTIHEFAHGWIAFKLGDPTARDAGRLTLNPIPHLDLLGSLMLLVGAPFGWAKPVPVNGYYFKKPKRDIFLVSAAGPVSNIILALILGYVYKTLVLFTPGLIVGNIHLQQFFAIAVSINLGLSFFNLLPVHPLDGSKILISLLPNKWIPVYLEKTKHLPLIFLILIVADWYMKDVSFFSDFLMLLFKPYYSFWTQFI